jgi:hypothetical protein
VFGDGLMLIVILPYGYAVTSFHDADRHQSPPSFTTAGWPFTGYTKNARGPLGVWMQSRPHAFRCCAPS